MHFCAAMLAEIDVERKKHDDEDKMMLAARLTNGK